MIVRCVSWSIFLCLALQQTAKAQVQIGENGYQNVLISFAPNVPSEAGKELVQSIQHLLEGTSSVLHAAIGIRIASATFRLPSSWPVETWENITVTPVSSEQMKSRPDIRVDATEHSPFGKRPVALQHGGCGVAGHQITLPLDFLSSTDGYPKEKLLAREWLKYRYGVFDENGFPGDSLYPDYYRIPGSTEIRITECTNSEVTYIFKKPVVGETCDMESEADFGHCRAHPDEESAANVTSSLMYFHEDLLNMEHICGKDNHTHHNTARNKQNALCNGQSIWDVVKQSKDFPNPQYQHADPVPETIQFSYIQESKPRFVVLLENSDNLHEKEIPIRFALRRFYYDLPPKSKLAIYTYNSIPAPVLPYTVLPAEGRDDLSTIADFGSPPTSICTSCGLAKAMEILQQNSDLGKGSILLITASPLELSEKPENSEICLRVLRFTKDSEDKSYDGLNESFDCFHFEILRDDLDDLQTFYSLTNFLTNDMPEFTEDFESKTIISGEMSGQIPVTIPQDPMASHYVLWLGKSLGDSSIDCRAGETAVTLKPDVKATDIASFTLDPVDGDVTCKLSSTKLAAILTQVQMRTQKGHYFDFDTWFHDVSTEANQLPIIIYAKIYFGGYPVKDARVMMVVSTKNSPERIIKLLDNGRGDPDVTQYDGIYSGYFTDFVEVGKYEITVKIDDNGGGAKIVKENPPSRSAPCCGSIVISQEEGVPPFEMEKRIAYTAESKRPEDGYPPSKILDLQVEFDDASNVILSWTAPGGGKAVGYAIKLFQNRENAVLNFDTTGWDRNASNILPGDTGKEEEFVIPNDDLLEDATHYAAVRSWNEFNKKSEISNIAEFIIPKSGDEVTRDDVSSTPGGITDDENTKRAQVRKRTIEIVVGVLAGIVVLCILVYLGVYFFVQRPRRKEEKARARKKAENGGGQRTVSNPSGQIGLNSIPADVIVKHHNEVEKAKSLHKDPPIFKEENLDSLNSSPELPENTRRNNKAAQYTMMQKTPEGTASNSGQQDPSKSPKRMTVV